MEKYHPDRTRSEKAKLLSQQKNKRQSKEMTEIHQYVETNSELVIRKTKYPPHYHVTQAGTPQADLMKSSYLSEDMISCRSDNCFCQTRYDYQLTHDKQELVVFDKNKFGIHDVIYYYFKNGVCLKSKRSIDNDKCVYMINGRQKVHALVKKLYSNYHKKFIGRYCHELLTTQKLGQWLDRIPLVYLSDLDLCELLVRRILGVRLGDYESEDFDEIIRYDDSRVEYAPIYRVTQIGTPQGDQMKSDYMNEAFVVFPHNAFSCYTMYDYLLTWDNSQELISFDQNDWSIHTIIYYYFQNGVCLKSMCIMNNGRGTYIINGRQEVYDLVGEIYQEEHQKVIQKCCRLILKTKNIRQLLWRIPLVYLGDLELCEIIVRKILNVAINYQM